MTKNAEILLISSIIIIVSYFTGRIAHNVGLSMIGSIPTARAGNHKWHYADMNPEIVEYGVFLSDLRNGDFKNFAEWQTKRIFKQTLQED